MVLRRFGLKTGIDFAYFGLESVMVFEELRSVWTYSSFQFQMSTEEREICEFEMYLKNFLSALLSAEVMISQGQVWKRVWILEV